MSAHPGRLPLLKRLSPGHWTAIVWGGAMAFACVDEFFVLPGDYVRDGQAVPGFDLTYVSGPILLGAAVLVLTACRLLRGRPLVAYALLLLGSVLGAGLIGQADEFPLVQFLAPDVALYFVAATAPRRVSGCAAGMALTVLMIPPTVRLSGGGGINTAAQLAVALTVLVAWLLGNSARQSRIHAEQARAQAAVQATTAERLRIARELHDVVAHTIGIVALQAGAARRVIDTQPARAREALGEVENASRETLSGLRRMLGALRQADAAGAPPREAPSLSDVEELAAATTAAGVRVVVRWHGRRRPLPPDIDLSAYRIVQESVTNVVRHAGARSCLVRVDHRDTELTLEITDTGRGPDGDGSRAGHGLLGMRERVALLRGEFTAGARPEGGFRVTARLPLPLPLSTRCEEPTSVAS
ncbi:sensor histidine kinase [Streptomyces sp. LRE541]|uniref:sensor histidine kinase n=1 Tax=Streptomyces sp. LRE541 TaxID=2931983 RepID=UPI00200D6DBC|nr:sensor histidine kinase [Streptomyces sp. LRE541]UPZ26820.1 sensor histidine kinase [Streptomyces sp. LRE541]